MLVNRAHFIYTDGGKFKEKQLRVLVRARATKNHQNSFSACWHWFCMSLEVEWMKNETILPKDIPLVGLVMAVENTV